MSLKLIDVLTPVVSHSRYRRRIADFYVYHVVSIMNSDRIQSVSLIPVFLLITQLISRTSHHQFLLIHAISLSFNPAFKPTFTSLRTPVRAVSGLSPLSNTPMERCSRFFGHSARSASNEDHHRAVTAVIRNK